jgi:hypothetical protein
MHFSSFSYLSLSIFIRSLKSKLKLEFFIGHAGFNLVGSNSHFDIFIRSLKSKLKLEFFIGHAGFNLVGSNSHFECIWNCIADWF